VTAKPDWSDVLLVVQGRFQWWQPIPPSILNTIAGRSSEVVQLLRAYNQRISALNMGMSSAGLHDLTRMILKRIEHEAGLQREAQPSTNLCQSDCQEGRNATPEVDPQLHSDPVERVFQSATIALGREEIKEHNSENAKRISVTKLRANRLNSLRSTGPRTPQGKQVVRQNAITHGLLSDPIIALSPEELAKFETWRSKLLTRIGPKNEVEARLIGNVAVLIWRLNGCIRTQGSLLSTTGPNDRWRTLHRYAGSLNRQLREKISDLYVLRNPKKGAMYVR
jgi:hypothetical protein